MDGGGTGGGRRRDGEQERDRRATGNGFAAGVFLACVAAFALTLRLSGGVSLADEASAAELSDVEQRALVTQATLRISVRDCAEVTLGSGFVVDDHLVTNEHLLSGAREVKVDRPIAPVRVPVTAASPELDLAVGPAPPALSLRIATEPAVIGDRVVLAGHADGRATEIRNGNVVNRVHGELFGITGQVLLIDAEIRGGYSGGPVIDGRGDVVAVLSGFDRATGLTIAVPAERLEAFLAELPDEPSAPVATERGEGCGSG